MRTYYNNNMPLNSFFPEQYRIPRKILPLQLFSSYLFGQFSKSNFPEKKIQFRLFLNLSFKLKMLKFSDFVALHGKKFVAKTGRYTLRI